MDSSLKLNPPFWWNYEINWRQLYWLEMFLSSRYMTGGWEIEIPEGKLIFYKDGTVRLITKETL